MAARAGVSHGLVFQHFGSKKGLYLETVRVLLDRFDAQVGPDPDLPPEERLRSSLLSYIDFALDHPRGFRALMLPAFAEVRELVEEGRWRGVRSTAAGAGLDLDRPDVRVALRGWIGFMEGTLLAAAEAPERPSRERLVELLTAPLLGTVAALSAPPARA